jgi:hypothetical protein
MKNLKDFELCNMPKSQRTLNVHHRFFCEDDFPLLENLLYEAIFQPEGAEPLPRDIIKKPEIDSAIRDFGKKRETFVYSPNWTEKQSAVRGCVFQTTRPKVSVTLTPKRPS